MKEFETYILPNGIKGIHRRTKSSIAHCALVINAGTRDERKGEEGIAHFTEHGFFKGTEHRKAHQVNCRLENLGGELNAYTTKEDTTVHATVLRGDFTKAVELLADVVFHSTFPDHELDKEREVILDEINTYRDSPMDAIYDEYEDLIFAGSELGHNILGTPKHVKHFTTASARSFTERYYHPSNAVLFVYGNIPFSRIVTWAERFTANIPSGSANTHRTAPLPYVPRQVELSRRTHQTHVMIGCTSYPSGDKRRTGLYLLNNMLGGPGMNSRLNLALREHTGLVYSVESNLMSYTDTGVFSIYFGTDTAEADRCIELTLKELDRLREHRLTTLQLAAAKKQLIGQVGVASDHFENTALGMAKTYLHYGEYEGSEALFRRIEALTAEELWDISNELFRRENLAVLIYR